MTYKEWRYFVKTGDPFLVAGNSGYSFLIRSLTASSFSHTGLFIWFGRHLFIAELKENMGFRLLPASVYLQDYLNKNQEVWVGYAPEQVRKMHNKSSLADFMLSFRDTTYLLSRPKTWFSLIKAGIGSVFNIDLGDVNICSGYNKLVWEFCGYDLIKETPSPETIRQHTTSLMRIEG